MIGVIAMMILSRTDYEFLSDFWIYIYIFNIVFLCSLFIFGEGMSSTGNQNWIRFGIIGIQPAEIVKISFIFVLGETSFYGKR